MISKDRIKIIVSRSKKLYVCFWSRKKSKTLLENLCDTTSIQDLKTTDYIKVLVKKKKVYF